MSYGILVVNPYGLMGIRSGSDRGGYRVISTSYGGMGASMHTLGNPTYCERDSFILAYLSRSGGVKGDSDTAGSTVLGVEKYSLF